MGSGWQIPRYSGKRSSGLQNDELMFYESDDKTVKVWEVDSWTCVKSVEEPFEGSPKSTFFRRLRCAGL